MPLELALLRAITSLDDAVLFFNQMGYTAAPKSVDSVGLGLGDQFARNQLLRQGQRRREGYAVFITEVDQIQGSPAILGRRLLQNVHDHPLGMVGIRGADGKWERFLLLRPRLLRSEGRTAYKIFKLEVTVGAPTHHDRDVLDRIRWDSTADDPQAQIDEAFDIEAVTRRFFAGLRDHYDRVATAVESAANTAPHLYRAIEEAGGHERVAIRIICQLLFCWFLQRKGLLANDRDYLVNRWRRKRGSYYRNELEPLFYETMAVPHPKRRNGVPGPEIPFLNGGLFYRTYGEVSLDLPDDLFSRDGGLLDYFSSWTFTISEEAPDEVNVAVDPELLGRVFEHLIADEEQAKHGVVYTPRPVVQFMCREALAAWMAPRLSLSEEWCRRLLTAEEPLREYQEALGVSETLNLAKRLSDALDELTVIDPAVGSGAFLLGMMSEIVRLQVIGYVGSEGRAPSLDVIRQWKLHCIEQTLFGVDIEPLALELCRLRLWLSLIADLPNDDTAVPPLPNLEYRTVAADSLTDYVAQYQLQQMRVGTFQKEAAFTLDIDQAPRHAYFRATDPEEKKRLREQLRKEEDEWVEDLLQRAEEEARQAKGSGRMVHIRKLRERFHSQDRVFPIFMPAFHAPEVMERGKWDIVIMNPPYLGKKEVAKKADPERRLDYEKHHGEKNDLMILFAYRARELVRPGGVCALIFNDSIFTSTDANRFRRLLLSEDQPLTLARTKCFEGQAVNGGVIVWQRQADDGKGNIRWVEGYKRDPRDFAAANDALPPAGPQPAKAGEMELFVVPSRHFRAIPNRPLFRPAPEALKALDWFGNLEPQEVRTGNGWDRLSDTPALKKEIQVRRQMGWYERLRPGQFVALGYCIEGGQGLATADDKRFLAAVDGTPEAETCREQQVRLVAQIEAMPSLVQRWQALRKRMEPEAALLELCEDVSLEKELKWPRLFRVAPRSLVRTTSFTDEERDRGIKAGPFFVPFEKGDQSGETETGVAIAATWWRENPVVIDWSADAVRLLRSRAEGPEAHRKPRIQSERQWGQGGVTWNEITSYLRVRLVEPGTIFGHKTPTINPIVDWLDIYALMALLNSGVLDFTVRTFLGSRMQVEVGDIRRIPVPVLTPAQTEALSRLGKQAVAFAQAEDTAGLRRVEAEVNRYVRNLYGMPQEAKLWVVR